VAVPIPVPVPVPSHSVVRGSGTEGLQHSLETGTIRPGDVMRAPTVSSYVESGSSGSGNKGSRVLGSDPIASNQTNSEDTPIPIHQSCLTPTLRFASSTLI
jgi:hypothetical protein